MSKKSIVTSLRMDDEQYLKLKELKEQYNVSWNELIKYVNTLLENEDIKKGAKDHEK